MIGTQTLQSQFKRLGYRPSILTRGEIKELPNILVPGEIINHIVTGWYDGGIAILCATNHRVLLVDKKPFFLTVEDLRYEMIAEVRYQYRLMDANVCLTYYGKSLDFKSWNQSALRRLVSSIQEVISSFENYRHKERELLSSRTINADDFIKLQSVKPLATESTATYPIENYQAPDRSSWPKNPYQTGKQLFRRPKASRFITQSQLSR